MRLDFIRNTGSANYETDYSRCLMSKAKRSEGCVKEKRIKITVDSYEILVTKQRGSSNRLWCSSCGKQAAVISLNDACRSGLTIEAAQREVENGRLHLIKTVVGPSFVCLDSLVRAASIVQANNPPVNRIHRILNQSEREEK
jgi:hypothetical protein